MMESTLLELHDVQVSYHGQRVLNQVNLEVREKDFIGIIGPNGGGKTTLLKVVMGLIKPDKGWVRHHMDARDIGYLPQGNQVDEKFPISVREVVASGLSQAPMLRQLTRRKEQKQLDQILDQLGLGALAGRPIGELSGGELQRSLLARAIVSSPRLLILDEPDTHVDNKFEMELYALLRELNASMTILLVSHDIGIISPYIKTIACVNRDLHYHASNEINEEQLKVYNCPIEIISHGTVPHRVMLNHRHD
jgi:zinc transport system ATP-binding protein